MNPIMKIFLYCLLILLSNNSVAHNNSSLNHAPVSTILVFGDSLSAAYNIPVESGWVSLLQDLVNKKGFKINLINASISGETTDGGLKRLPSQLKKYQPDIVILELGGNDGLRGFDLNTTRKNLDKMVSLSLSQSSKVLLAGIKIPPNYGRTYTRRFSNIYQQLAVQDKVELIPFILDKVATIPELMQADGIHPNAKGQPIIVENVWHYLEQMIEQKPHHQ